MMKVTFILITYCIGCIAIRTTLQTNVKANKNLPSASKKIDLFLYGSLDQFSRQKYSMYTHRHPLEIALISPSQISFLSL
jgi:hypothetical protein